MSWKGVKNTSKAIGLWPSSKRKAKKYQDGDAKDSPRYRPCQNYPQPSCEKNEGAVDQVHVDGALQNRANLPFALAEAFGASRVRRVGVDAMFAFDRSAARCYFRWLHTDRSGSANSIRQ